MLPTRRGDKTRLTDPSKRRAPKQEKELSKVLGARQTNGSGNQTEKGDLRIKGTFRVEAKCTRNKSFSVTRELIDKLENAAYMTRTPEMPVLHVEFLTPEGVREKGLYIMLEEDVEELIRRRASDAGIGSTAEARTVLPTQRRK